MIHLAILCFLISDKMQIRNGSFTSEFVNELGLPKKHDVFGVLYSFLNLGREKVACLPLLDFVDISKGASSQLFDDLVPLVQNLLSFFHIVFF